MLTERVGDCYIVFFSFAFQFVGWKFFTVSSSMRFLIETYVFVKFHEDMDELA